MKSRFKTLSILLLAMSLLVGCGGNTSETPSETGKSSDDLKISVGDTSSDSSTNTGVFGEVNENLTNTEDGTSNTTDDISNNTEDTNDTTSKSDKNTNDDKDTKDKSDKTEDTNKLDTYDGVDIPSDVTMADNLRGGWITSNGDTFEFLGSGEFTAYIAKDNLQWKGTYETDNSTYVKLEYNVYDMSKEAKVRKKLERKAAKEERKQRKENLKALKNGEVVEDASTEPEVDEVAKEEIINDGDKIIKRTYDKDGNLLSEEDYTDQYNARAEETDIDKAVYEEILVSKDKVQATYEIKFSVQGEQTNYPSKVVTMIKGKQKIELSKQYDI